MASLDKIWLEAERTLKQGKPFALATVINVRGSTPREVGAKMLVRDDGQIGTIGGGCGEAEVYRKAQLLLEESAPSRLAEVDLTGDFEQQEIGTCGGIMDVFIDLWSPVPDLPLAREMAEAVRGSQPLALVTLVQPGAGARSPQRALLRPNTESAGLPVELPAKAIGQLAEIVSSAVPALVEIDPRGELRTTTHLSDKASQLFVDPLPGAQRLIIIGAGHVGQALADLGAMLGFHVIVIDDRGAFANRERFPTAAEIIVRPFEKAIDSLKLDRNSYVVAVTRGHAFDEIALRAALKQKPGYVGMIGSKRRVRATLDRIKADGVDKSVLEQVHAPIGLHIGAETPEEIAVSIMAEIIRERRLGVRDETSMGVKLGRLKPAN
ncbi:MAG TPA: XdhC/CoxI family protein [Candidatus Binataceae bacterium]